MLAGGALLVVMGSPLPAAELTKDVDSIRVELASSPGEPVTRRETEYVVRLTHEAGVPVTGARVTLRGRMTDGMTVVAPLRPAAEPGVYRGRLLYTMEGRWDLSLRVSRDGKQFEVPLTEQVAR
jgi:hypothetical protein